MAISLNVPARNTILDSGANAAFDSGRFRIYSGAKPATANLAPTGTLLVDITLPADVFAAAADGSIALNAALETDLNGAEADGVAGWFRLSAVNDDDTLDGAFARLDGTVGGSGSGEDLELQNTNIATGQAVSITDFTVTLPAAA